MKKLIIFGVKKFADMGHYLFSEDSDYSVETFCVDGAYIDKTSYKGLPVIPFEELEKDFSQAEYDMFVAIGIEKVNGLRAQKAEEIKNRGYRLASFVSSKATVSKNFVAHPNTMIMDHVNVHPFVEIGWDTIVWSNSRIALKSQIGAHCWITSAILGESLKLGDYSFIGLNATVAPFLSIGKRNIIGAGALILKDSEDNAVFKGCESKPSRVPSSRVRLH